MENKDIVIIALIVVIIYLAYQQSQENSQSPLIVESPNTQKLRDQLNHYQTLYQKRVEKDLSGRTSFVEFQELQKQAPIYQQALQEKAEISQELKGLKEQLAGQDLGEILTSNQQKDHTITQLETEIKELKKAKENLLQEKATKQKETQKIIQALENKWTKEKEGLTNKLTKTETKLESEKQSWQTNLQILTQLQNFHHLVEKSSSTSLDREQVNHAEALVEQITQPELKQLASWMVTDSAFILGHNNLLDKLADQEDKTEQLREQHQDHLRKINVLFDAKAQDYQVIDFNGLYSLLSSIAERERERESKSKKWWRK